MIKLSVALAKLKGDGIGNYCMTPNGCLGLTLEWYSKVMAIWFDEMVKKEASSSLKLKEMAQPS